MSEKVAVTFRIEKKLRDQLEKIAHFERRTMTGVIEAMIDDRWKQTPDGKAD